MKFQNNGHGVAIPSLGIGFIANEEIVEVPDDVGERLRTAPFFSEIHDPEDEDAEPIAARHVFVPAVPTPIAEGPEVEPMTDEEKAAAEAEIKARDTAWTSPALDLDGGTRPAQPDPDTGPPTEASSETIPEDGSTDATSDVSAPEAEPAAFRPAGSTAPTVGRVMAKGGRPPTNEPAAVEESI